MATEVIIPALGVIVEKVKIVQWLKLEDDRVKEGEPLLEIESEKVTTEIVSPASGILGCILYPEGAEVPVTTVAAVIVAEGEAVPESYRQQVEEGAPPSAPMVAPSVPLAEKVPKSIKAAPAARKLAEKKGVDLSLVTPTGPHGTVMKKDVETYLASAILEKKPRKVSIPTRKKTEEQLEAIPEEESLFGKVIPMNKMRQIIARRMSESAFTAPHIYFFTDVNMENVGNVQESIREDCEKRFNVRLSINDFLIKAVALAIREYPLLNAMVKGDEVHVHPEINIGLAVALDDGLIVPAIPQADKLGLGTIAQKRVDLVERARKGKLTISEVESGTFTISSLANFDITFFTAILNPPQSGILSVGKIQDQLYLEDGEVRTRRVANCGLAVDHRIIDGVVAAKFLQTIKKIVENPYLYLLNL